MLKYHDSKEAMKRTRGFLMKDIITPSNYTLNSKINFGQHGSIGFIFFKCAKNPFYLDAKGIKKSYRLLQKDFHKRKKIFSSKLIFPKLIKE